MVLTCRPAIMRVENSKVLLLSVLTGYGIVNAPLKIQLEPFSNYEFTYLIMTRKEQSSKK